MNAGQYSSGKSKNALIAIIIILVISSVFWVWFGLTQKSIDEDEGISILSAQGVLEHGYPLLPSGFLYHRGYFPAYILAGSIGILGLNDFSIILPGVLFALGSLWLTFLFGKNVLGNSWLGVGAAALLITLQITTYSATSPRMYIFLQFFSLLFIYFGYFWFTTQKYKYLVLAGLSVLASIFSHRLGGSLIFSLPLFTFLSSWFTRKKLRSIFGFKQAAVYGLVLLGILYLFVYTPPNVVKPVAVHGGEINHFVGINFNFVQLSRGLYQLESVFPFSFPFIFLIPLVLIKAVNNKNFGLVFTIFMYVFSLVPVLVFLHLTKTRYWMFILPLSALLLCVLISEALQAVKAVVRGDLSPGYYYPKLVLILIGVGILVYGGLNTGLLSSRYRAHSVEAFQAAYGNPCQSEECHPQIEKIYKLLKPGIKPQDFIVSTNPWVSRYYLGRVDGFLREKKTGRREDDFSAFEKEKDEYLGIPLIDRISKLQGLLEKYNRVWVFVDYKKKEFVSQRVINFLEHNLDQQYYQFLIVYQNSSKIQN